MRSSLWLYPNPEERITVNRADGEVRYIIEGLVLRLSVTQTLDLGMKIQKVVSEIDRENGAYEEVKS